MTPALKMDPESTAYAWRSPPPPPRGDGLGARTVFPLAVTLEIPQRRRLSGDHCRSQSWAAAVAELPHSCARLYLGPGDNFAAVGAGRWERGSSALWTICTVSWKRNLRYTNWERTFVEDAMLSTHLAPAAHYVPHYREKR